MGNRKTLNNIIKQQDALLDDDSSCLTDEEWYLSPDDRYWQSNIEDVEGGDNFADYCKYFFNLLEEEDYFED